MVSSAVPHLSNVTEQSIFGMQLCLVEQSNIFPMPLYVAENGACKVSPWALTHNLSNIQECEEAVLPKLRLQTRQAVYTG